MGILVSDLVFVSEAEGVTVNVSEEASAEEVVSGLVFLMEQAATRPDFDPLAFQGQLMAAMTQGAGS